MSKNPNDMIQVWNTQSKKVETVTVAQALAENGHLKTDVSSYTQGSGGANAPKQDKSSPAAATPSTQNKSIGANITNDDLRKTIKQNEDILTSLKNKNADPHDRMAVAYASDRVEAALAATGAERDKALRAIQENNPNTWNRLQKNAAASPQGAGQASSAGSSGGFFGGVEDTIKDLNDGKPGAGATPKKDAPGTGGEKKTSSAGGGTSGDSAAGLPSGNSGAAGVKANQVDSSSPSRSGAGAGSGSSNRPTGSNSAFAGATASASAGVGGPAIPSVGDDPTAMQTFGGNGSSAWWDQVNAGLKQLNAQQASGSANTSAVSTGAATRGAGFGAGTTSNGNPWIFSGNSSDPNKGTSDQVSVDFTGQKAEVISDPNAAGAIQAMTSNNGINTLAISESILDSNANNNPSYASMQQTPSDPNNRGNVQNKIDTGDLISSGGQLYASGAVENAALVDVFQNAPTVAQQATAGNTSAAQTQAVMNSEREEAGIYVGGHANANPTDAQLAGYYADISAAQGSSGGWNPTGANSWFSTGQSDAMSQNDAQAVVPGIKPGEQLAGGVAQMVAALQAQGNLTPDNLAFLQKINDEIVGAKSGADLNAQTVAGGGALASAGGPNAPTDPNAGSLPAAGSSTTPAPNNGGFGLDFII